MKSEMSIEAVKLTPGAGVGGAYLFGIAVPTIVLWLTGLYYTVLLVTLLRDKWFMPWYKARKERQHGKDLGQRGCFGDTASLDDGAVHAPLKREADSPYL